MEMCKRINSLFLLVLLLIYKLPICQRLAYRGAGLVKMVPAPPTSRYDMQMDQRACQLLDLYWDLHNQSIYVRVSVCKNFQLDPKHNAQWADPRWDCPLGNSA